MGGRFELLDPHKDRDKWREVLAKLPLPLRDVHMAPEYMAAQALLGVTPRLAVYSYMSYVVCQPIIVRDVFPISVNTPYDQTPETGWACRDMSSPYSYGGAVSNHGHALFDWFNESLNSWARENRIVCEFCALNPFMTVHQLSLIKRTGMRSVTRKQVVWMDLTGDFMDGYHGNRLQAVRNALRNGVRARIESDASRFVECYRKRMLRKQAAARWHFPDEYMYELCKLGDLHVAEVDGQVETYALVLHDGDTAYYHFAASEGWNPQAGANDYLVHEIARTESTRGSKRLHLGGGVTSAVNDPVLYFKAGFSDLRLPAMSYFRVFDEVAYKQLCAEKVRREVDETGKAFTTTFEPMYRREAS